MEIHKVKYWGVMSTLHVINCVQCCVWHSSHLAQYCVLHLKRLTVVNIADVIVKRYVSFISCKSFISDIISRDFS